MNPDRNNDGMTINALMQIGLVSSVAIPVILIAILGYFASQRVQSSDSTFVLVVVASAIIVLMGVLIFRRVELHSIPVDLMLLHYRPRLKSSYKKSAPLVMVIYAFKPR